MIVFSRAPEPSSLLWTKDLNRVGKSLLAQVKDDAFLQQPGAIDLLWQRAQSLDEQGEAEAAALVSIRLAELFRRCGRLGPALKCVERAKAILSKWPHKRQRQNHAVALYACGLVHQFLGSYEDAYACYEEALALFREAEAQRRSLGTPGEFEDRCAEAEAAIEELSTYVARAGTCGDAGAIWFCSLMSYCLAERNPLEDVQLGVSVRVKSLEVDMALQHGHQSYRLELLEGATVGFVPQPDTEYGVLPVPDEIAQAPTGAKAPPELQDAKYALVEDRIGTGSLGVGAARAKDDTLLWGEFVRDPRTKRILLVSRYPTPRFIGEEDLDPVVSGSIVGVFK